MWGLLAVVAIGALIFGAGSAIAAIGAILGIAILAFFVIALIGYAVVEWWRS